MHYNLDKWQSSRWYKGTRYYSIELCQNLFGEWVIRRTWGGKNTRGAGKLKTVVCQNHHHALEVYQKQQHRRTKRGYRQQQNF